MKRILPRYEAVLAAGIAFCGLALAQEAMTPPAPAPGTAPATDAAPAIPTAGTAARRLTTAFTGFAGSQANATALVDGLRSGSAIMLTSTGDGGRVSAVTFMPPTQAMGWGNVRIALSLAQAKLAAQGISQPTPQQLQEALTGSGGTGSSSGPGVLQLRAQGMGWGEVAESMGVKLGAVMNNRAATAAAAAGSGDGAGMAAPAKVTTAAGSGGYGAPGRSSGIVTAGGGAAGVLLTSHGHGIVAGGGAVNGQGIVHGNGGLGNPGRGGGKT